MNIISDDCNIHNNPTGLAHQYIEVRKASNFTICYLLFAKHVKEY